MAIVSFLESREAGACRVPESYRASSELVLFTSSVLSLTIIIYGTGVQARAAMKKKRPPSRRGGADATAGGRCWGLGRVGSGDRRGGRGRRDGGDLDRPVVLAQQQDHQEAADQDGGQRDPQERDVDVALGSLDE